MEFEQVIKLVETVSASGLTRFMLEDGDFKIEMKADHGQAEWASVQPVKTAALPSDAGEKKDSSLVEVISPLVGTFYRSPSPEAEVFVKMGETVKQGQVLGIVEAMKLMNEITAETDGVITDILVENEAMIEYGQVLFTIKPDRV